jgi:putative transcriptional regulator
MKSLTGSLLVASPKLPDPNFYRAVVFMVEHGEGGALGVILNRPGNTTLRHVWESVADSVCESDRYLHVGGPVDGPLMALHDDADLDGMEVIPHVYFSSERMTLEALVAQQEKPFRIFSGYAGWGPGQLDDELKAGGWLIARTHPHHIFQDHDDLWQNLTHSIGAQITDQALRIRHLPVDPRAN